MADAARGSQQSRTIFVRNLPLSTTNDKLEDVFSNVGPLKRCFVVKDKGKEQCRGYGYVTYSTPDDAQRAISEIRLFGGRKLQIDFADKKSKRKQQKSKKKINTPSASQDLSSDESDSDDETKKDADKQNDLPISASSCGSQEKDSEGLSKSDPLFKKTWKLGIIELSDLPGNVQRKDIENYFKGTKYLLAVKFPLKTDGELKGSAMFTNKATAMNAFMTVKKRKMMGSQIKLEVKTMTPVAHTKKAKLIVRNLSFQCNEDKLMKEFRKFGAISEVNIPKSSDGKKRGFGFVQFSEVKDAASALKSMNAQKILGRPVAVDWAVEREKYTSATGVPTKENESPIIKETESSKIELKGKSKKTSSKTREAVTKQSSSTASNTHEERGGKVAGRTRQGSDSDDNSDGDSSSDDDSDSEIDEEDTDMDGSDSSNSEDETDNDEDENDYSDDDDDGDEDDVIDEEDTKLKKVSKRKFTDKSDVDEGRTIFIRNLSFDTFEDDLEEYLGKFGKIEYCRVVRDPSTEHSRGTAFVKFKSKEDAEKCLLESQNEGKRDGGGLILDKRKLNAVLALPRSQAEQLKKPKEKEKDDKRNLYLAREGMIRPGTQAAEGLRVDDLAKRQKVDNMKRQKLKNPDIFISKTRLCVRNVPVKIDDKELRKIFIKHAGDKRAIIKECRIMRDLTQVTKGAAKSKGYAFVEFTEHAHALNALRNTNNNPEIFGEKKRLIVEFSLENRKALELKQKRRERAKMKLDSQKSGEAYQRNRWGPNAAKGTSSSKFERGNKMNVCSRVPSEGDKKKGPKGLPSHWGPKIRHKPRGPVESAEKPRGKLSRQESKKRKGPRSVWSTEMVPPTKKKRTKKYKKPQRREKPDDFEKMVNKYKKKLVGGAAFTNKRSKWFGQE